MNNESFPKPIKLSPDELARQKSRSRALGLVLGALVVLFFAVTIAKLGGDVFNRPM